jgi:SSS family solute:Na+ symporter
VTAEEYFLSSRSLRWPSIAISTIATNISAGHFITMAGSAYAFGLAQANLELNAIFGICLAAFFFVPLYLRNKVTTISQFFEMKFGPAVGLTYSVLMMAMYSILYLGMALFTAAYAIDGIFTDLVAWISPHQSIRYGVIIVAMGVFSAIYTYLGGLSAVVRTDIAQFVLLAVGGIIMLGIAFYKMGGVSALYETGLPQGVNPGDLTPHKMHLHLPAYHDKLPWVALIGMNLLNLNYWGANQVILQRALAAKSLKHAQVGLLVGGVLKYLMATIIIIPAIALTGMATLDDPDTAYLTMVNDWLPSGVRGIILCGLFASLMSTVDSIFNSVSTLWSIDVYKRYLKPDAPDAAVVRTGKLAIVGTLILGCIFAFIVIGLKAGSLKDDPMTHWFNEMTYYIKNGFVVLIMAAVFLKAPSRKLVLWAMFLTVGLYYGLNVIYPEMNYFVRSAYVITGIFSLVAIPTWIRNGWRIPLGEMIEVSSRRVGWSAAALFLSLVSCHIIFH